MLKRVTIRPDSTFTAQYPHALNTRVTIRCKDGREFSREHVGFEGGLENPLTWDRTVEKFHWLSEPHADSQLRHRIIELVEALEQHSIAELMALMATVHPQATYPARHAGIQ